MSGGLGKCLFCRFPYTDVFVYSGLSLLLQIAHGRSYKNESKNTAIVLSLTNEALGDDDGYLTASASQNEINTKNNPASFVDLYRIKVNNPSNYSLPRMMNLGLTVSF